MNISQILKMCRDEAVVLGVDGDTLNASFDQRPSDTLIGLIRDNKAALVAAIKSHQAQSKLASAKSQIVAGPRHDQGYELSGAQHRLWLAHKLSSDGANYNMPIALKVSGQFEHALAQTAFERVIAKHEALRTRFAEVDEKVLQFVEPEVDFVLAEIDGRGDTPEQLQTHVDNLFSHNFDLTGESLVKGALIRAQDSNEPYSILVLVVHHIVCDAWSIGLMTRDFVGFYQALSQQQSVESEKQPLGYVDYVLWQKENLTADALDTQLDYWVEQLKGAPAVHGLPTDFARSNHTNIHGAQWQQRIDKSLPESLSQACKRHGVTEFVMIHAAWALSMNLLSGQSDVIIGTPIANRTLPELETMVGVFVNTLALRSNVVFESTEQYLQAFKDLNAKAQANQDVQFEQVLDALELKRSHQHSPVFQVMLTVNVAGEQDLALPGLTFEPLHSEVSLAKFELDLTAVFSPEGLQLNWIYNKDLYSQQSIEQFSRCLESVLSGFADNTCTAQNPIGLLQQSYLDEIKEGSKTEFDGLTLDAVFEQQARLNPDAIALSYLDKSLTYGELNLAANRVAHQLLQNGVNKGDCVGIVCDRSIELIVAMLASLKIGAVYVPIDNDYPLERKQFMVTDTGTKVLLHSVEGFDEAGLVQCQPELVISALNVDEVLVREGTQSTDCNPVRSQVADDLAYVIYTSGSTGKSKGVMVTHKNVWRSVLADKSITIGQGDSVAYCANPAFDASTWEIWVTLLNGAKLSIVASSELKDINRFSRCLKQNQVSVLQLTAGLFKQIARSMLAEFQSLKYLLIGGDAPDIDAVKHVLKHGAPEHFIHTYGPTETVAFATYYEVTDKDLSAAHLPIGKPMANTGMYLLDESLNRMPAGSVAELYLSGDGVAKGYLNRPELTETAFINNPFGGGKLYKTGDLVRLNNQGELVFHGRIDHQVKVRGFRIEPGEVEQQLNRCEGVESSVVLAISDETGKRLVGYVQGSDDLNSQTIARELGQKLPDYMIPSFFVVMDEWPLTNNGKIDRRALPQPQDTIVVDQYVAPANEIESQLQNEWSKLLKLPLDKISVEANFFTLGGDSILSIQLTNNAAKLGLHFNPNVLFEQPTIRGIAEAINSGDRVLVEAPQEPMTGYLNLLPVQIAFMQDTVDWHYANQAVLLEVPENFDAGILKVLIEKLYQRHDALRLRYRIEPLLTAEFLPLSQQMVEETVSIHRHDGEDWAFLTEQLNEIHASMRPQQGQIFKAAYWPASKAQLSKGESAGRLLLAIHHLSVDTVSWRILMDDFLTLYQQHQQGKTLTLAAKTSSYQQWGEHIREYAQSPKLLEQKAYWLEQAASHVESVYLKQHQLVNVSLSDAKLKTAGFTLDKKQTAALVQSQFQLNELLLGALLLANREYCDIDKIKVEFEGHGRYSQDEKLDLNQTVGWFTSSYPLMLGCNGSDTFEAVVAKVRNCLQAVPDNGLGFGIHKDLLADEQLQNAQKPEWLFNYYGQIDGNERTDGETLDEPKIRMAKESVGQVQSLNRAGHYPLQFEAQVNLSQSGKNLSANITFDTAEYDAKVIENLMQHVQSILQEMAESFAGTQGPVYGEELLAQGVVQLNNLENSPSEKPAVFAFHPFSGRVDCYREMAQGLNDKVTVFGVQAPFVSNQRIRFTDISVLADFYAQSIISRQPKGPYRLFGWSAGGQLAYFVANALQQRGHQVDYLNMVEPMVPENDEVEDKVDYIKFLLGFIGLEDQTTLNKLDEIADEVTFEVLVAKAVGLLMAQNIAGLDNPELIETVLLAGVDYRTAHRPATKLQNIANVRLFKSEMAEEANYFERWQNWLPTDSNTDVKQGVLPGEHQTLMSENLSLCSIVDTLSVDLS